MCWWLLVCRAAKCWKIYVKELDDGFLKQFESPDDLEDGDFVLPYVEETIIKAMNEAEFDLIFESTNKKTNRLSIT